MKNIVLFYAYPRSGATVLSKILNNHDNFIVTPEMIDIATPVKGYSWKIFIKIFNKKFNASFSKNSSLKEIDNFLIKNSCFLFLRVWILGKYSNSPQYFESEITPEKKLFLIRNFFEILGSLGQFKLKNLKNNIPFGLTYFENMLNLIDDKSIVLHYEELVKVPQESLSNLYESLKINSINPNMYLNLNSKYNEILSGDTKINKTNSIKKISSYYKFQFNDTLYNFVYNKLSLRKEIKYTGLSNPEGIQMFLLIAKHYSLRIYSELRKYYMIIIKTVLKLRKK